MYRLVKKQKAFSDRIQMLKKGAVLLNFSRNELVDEDAMIMALEAGSVHRYVTDFPNPKNWYKTSFRFLI